MPKYISHASLQAPQVEAFVRPPNKDLVATTKGGKDENNDFTLIKGF